MRIALVTPYLAPDPDRSNNAAISRYSSNLVRNMPAGCDVTIICDQIEGVPDSYDLGTTKVRRRWSTGPMFFWQAFMALRRERPDVVHIQHEVFLYGRTLSAVLFPLLPLLLRAGGRPVVITLHNGILPLRKLNGEFLKENGIGGNPVVMKAGLTFLIKIISLVSTKVIVHEGSIKDTLAGDYGVPPRRIAVIHHGIEERRTPLPMDEAKKALGLEGKKVVLFLGFIAGYKNLDLLIESARHLQGDDWLILIGGGEHPRLKDDPRYLEYVSGLKRKAQEIAPDRVRFIGFVRDDELPLYVSASDMMVFPYRAFVSASGPLTIAMTYGRPILVSSAFRSFVNSEDDVFSDDPRDLASKMERVMSSPHTPEVRDDRYGELFEERRWDVVSEKTCEIYREVRSR